MLLSELLSKLDKRTCFDIVGDDRANGKTFNVFRGYNWQFILGGTCEDCEVISICKTWQDDTLRILCDIAYDDSRYTHGGAKPWR